MVTCFRAGPDDDTLASAVQEILPALGIPAEKTVVVSGAHGPAIATGICVNRADLSVWVVISDEDALAFGGSHVIQVLRRNVSLKIVALSDGAFDVVALALATGAPFVARALEGHWEHLTEMLAAAAAHSGAALVEVRRVRGRSSGGTPPPAEDSAVRLVQGRPILFGGQAVVRDPATGEMRSGSPADANVVVHDAAAGNLAHAFALSRLPETDVARIPVGVFRSARRETFDELFRQRSGADRGDLQQLLVSDDYHEEDRDDFRDHRALH